MDAWAARIAAAGVFCAEVLAAADVNAEMLALKCSTGGQVSAPFDVDLTNGTINTGKGVISAEVNNQAISWHEDGVLRTIKYLCSVSSVAWRLFFPDRDVPTVGEMTGRHGVE